jgi:formylglycine-generating enzyme required for sulfatase activity
MTGDFYFAGAPAPAPAPPVSPPPGAADEELAFWQSIRDSKSAADYKAYLARWPQGIFAELARLRVAQIEKAADRTEPAPETRRPGAVFRDCPDCPEMVVVPPGEFRMGSPYDEKERFPDEGPQRRVAIAAPFALGKYEIRRAQFARFAAEIGASPRACRVWRPAAGNFALSAAANWQSPGFEQSDDHPVVCVSWSEAKAMADWLAKKTGKPYRLPSEAEWEYAARAGTSSAWVWGDDAGGACAHANGADQAYLRAQRGAAGVACDDGFAFTAPVGGFRANAFGLHDLIGNVSEWTADCWRETFAGAPADGRAWVAGACRQRTTKGGAWLAPPRLLRSAVRGGVGADDRTNMLGFRLARDLEAGER